MAKAKINLAGRILEADEYSFLQKDRLSYTAFINGTITPSIVGKLPLEIKVNGFIPRQQQRQFVSSLSALVGLKGQPLQLDDFSYTVTLDHFELKGNEDDVFLHYELILHI